jgi:hypothetical protein
MASSYNRRITVPWVALLWEQYFAAPSRGTTFLYKLEQYHVTCSYPSLIRPRVISLECPRSPCESTYYCIGDFSLHGCGGEGQRRTTEEMVRVSPTTPVGPCLNIHANKKGEGPQSGRGNVCSRLSRFVYLVSPLSA